MHRNKWNKPEALYLNSKLSDEIPVYLSYLSMEWVIA